MVGQEKGRRSLVAGKCAARQPRAFLTAFISQRAGLLKGWPDKHVAAGFRSFYFVLS